MKKRLKQKITSILGLLGILIGIVIFLRSYFLGDPDLMTSGIACGVGLFLFLAEDELINQLTLGILKKIIK